VTRGFPHPLPNGWFQLAYSDELAVGEVARLDYFDRELVAFRGEDGCAHVLDAHCPHLGAHLGYGGEVSGNVIRCPFHAWEFDGAGTCVNVPYARRIPPQARIHAWRSVETNGMLFVHFDRDGREPDFEIPRVAELESEQWTAPYRRDFVVEGPAQELAENTVDPAHFKYVHKTAALPKARAWAEGPKLRVEMEYPMGVGERQQQGAIDITTWGFGFGLTRFTGIVDTLVIVTGTPIDPERTHNRMSFLLKKRESEQATRAIGEAFIDEIARQFEQDRPIWANKVHWERPLLCDGDGPIGVLRSWAQQFY
jgi:phenylpropionate dioxygenase-like ring-hydroxylating dioxygenase large terminal subunit